MTAPYIQDEMPLMGDCMEDLDEVYLDIPSLKQSLFSREHGITIYGSDSVPAWTISTEASKGNTAYGHWMESSIPLTVRLFTLILMKWISQKRVDAAGWQGKAIIVSGGNDSEIHFLVYSETLDVSLDLHMQVNEKSAEAFDKGIRFLDEVCLHDDGRGT